MHLYIYRFFLHFSVYAVDSLGKPSAPHVFEIILCTGCNQHGTCNFTEYKDGTYKTDPIKYAICDCDGDGNSNFWTGIFKSECRSVSLNVFAMGWFICCFFVFCV